MAAPVKAIDSLAEVAQDGAFKRSSSLFRNVVSSAPGAAYPPAAGRYALYVSYACPWASRCLAVRALKGLHDVIPVYTVAPVWGATKPGVDDHRGWLFTGPTAEDPISTLDPVFGAMTARGLYEAAEGVGATAKFSVPVLLDTVTRRIVSNESSEIVRMLNAEFNDFAKHPELDLYPAPLRAEIDAINEDVYNAVNDGVYRCGFAKSQAAYNKAFSELFAGLDRLEARLHRQRYLVGKQMTEADVRLFVTLVRFDAVYVVHFKCNKQLLREYPSLFAYTRDIYQHDGVAATVNMWHIKHHYYGSHTTLNPYGIIPLGLENDFSAPHGREVLP